MRITRHLLFYTIGIIIVLLLFLYYLVGSNYTPATRDAYVEANVIKISAQVAGNITQVYVTDFERVKKEQPLFQIDARRYQIALKTAEASYDHAKESNATNAQIMSAEAALEKAKLDLSETTIYAPDDGYVTYLKLRVGEYATVGARLLTFVSNREWWVIAKFKESFLHRIKPGQSADISLDMYPGHNFKGKVLGAAWGVSLTPTPEDTALPYSPQSTNWIKLDQEFPVRVNFLKPYAIQYPLRVGASAHVTIYTGHNIFLNFIAYVRQQFWNYLNYL